MQSDCDYYEAERLVQGGEHPISGSFVGLCHPVTVTLLESSAPVPCLFICIYACMHVCMYV